MDRNEEDQVEQRIRAVFTAHADSVRGRTAVPDGPMVESRRVGRVRRRRPTSPLLIAAAIVIALGVAGFWIHAARSSNHRPAHNDINHNSPSDAPRENIDHWHAAFGISNCGTWERPVTDATPDVLGIHSHDDGLIHIHPFSALTSGRNATLARFLSQEGLVLGSGTLRYGKKWTISAASGCGGQSAQLVIEVWSASARQTDSRPVIISRPSDVVFVQDQMAVAIALIPDDGATTGLPPSVANLADPLAREGGVATTTWLPGSAPPTTTVPQHTSGGVGSHPYAVPAGTAASARTGTAEHPIAVGFGRVGPLRVGTSLRSEVSGSNPSIELHDCSVTEVPLGQGEVEVVTHHDGDTKDAIVSIYGEDPDLDLGTWWRTAVGISGGATTSELHHAYGDDLGTVTEQFEPYLAPTSMRVVTHGGYRLLFEMRHNKVVGFITGSTADQQAPPCG